MAKLSAATAKLKTKTLKSVTRNNSIASRLPKVSDDWLAKPIVGNKIRPTTGGNGGPQLTSAFKREQDASPAESVKLREQRRRLLFRTTNTTLRPTPWSPLRQAELMILYRLQRQRRVRKRPRRSRSKRSYKADRSLPDGMQIANIDHLRSLLSLDGSRPSCDVTFVSIDCEFTQVQGTQYVTEIGITTLKASDVMNTAPGLFIRDWTSKLKHHHMIVNYGKTARWKEKSALFAQSQHVSGHDARIAVQDLMKGMIPSGSDSDSDSDSQGYFALVGHSTWGDIDAMIKCPDLGFDIRTIGGPGLKLLNVFDTFWLGMDAKREGADLSGLRLGTMANSIGIDPVYRSDDAVIGWHNASNDAAYTMVCFLTFAADWNVLIGKETRSAVVQDEIRCAEAAHTAQCTVLAHGKIQRAEKSYKGYGLEARRSARRSALDEARELLLAERSTTSLSSSSSWSSSWWDWLKGFFSSETKSANEVAGKMAERLVDGEKRKHESYLRQGGPIAGGSVGNRRVRAKGNAQDGAKHEPADVNASEATLHSAPPPLASNERPITSDTETRAKEIPQAKTKRGFKVREVGVLTLAMKQKLLDAVVGIEHPRSSDTIIPTSKAVPQVEVKSEKEDVNDNDGRAPRRPIASREQRAARTPRIQRAARIERVPRVPKVPREPKTLKTPQAETKHEAENVVAEEEMSTEVLPQVEATHQSERVELDGSHRVKEVPEVDVKLEPVTAKLEQGKRAEQVLQFQAQAKTGTVKLSGLRATPPHTTTLSPSPPSLPPRKTPLCPGPLCHGKLCPGPLRILHPPPTIGPDDAPIPRLSKRQKVHNRIVGEVRVSIWWKYIPLSTSSSSSPASLSVSAARRLQRAFYEDVREREERELGRLVGKESWWVKVRGQDERRVEKEMRVMKGGLLGR